MWEVIKDFFTASPWWELLLIFCSRIIEVSIGTLRIILVNKGYRRIGAFLAFFEILLWVFVASRVITNIYEQPIRGIVYCLGFAFGVYVGSRLESKIAFGKVLIQTITTEEMGMLIVAELRNHGYGVTTVKAQGKDNEKLVIMVYANRRGKDQLINLIQNIDDRAMIVTNDLSTLQGGYISSGWKKFVK
ncbi:MAG TPA: DUF2179 domain-containing protein [Acholeplasmataceae bacterium]|jgi:uncharacterized protein YebE (UPF0316 family)|nr:DUF2179 domain-containing protein [Acholeplasmataceae bacterium]